MIEHYLGSEAPWAIWSFHRGTLRDLGSGTFTGWVYVQGNETAGTDLTGTFAGATGAGTEPSGTPNLTYTPATNEFVGTLTAGQYRLRVVWSVADTVVFDGPITLHPAVT